MGKGLHITRRAGESVYIGDDIVITVESTESGQVGLRIAAPAHVGIHRDADRVPQGLRLAASVKKGKGR